MTKETDKLWNANFIKVSAANFLLFFAFYLLMPLLPLYLNDTFHSTKDVIGAVLSGYTVAALIARPFSGFLVDTFPRKQVLLTCYFLFFIFFAGYLAAGSLLLFGIIRTLHGVPFGALTVANSTVAIDVLPSSRRTEGIGYYGLSNNLAMATGPTVAIYLFDWVGSYEVLFWAALIIAGIGLWVDATVKLKPRPLVQGKRALSLDRFFLVAGTLLFLNMVGFGYSYGVLSTYLAIYAKETMGVTSSSGTFFLILAVGLMCSRLQGASALRKGRVVHNASMGMCISLVGYTLFVAVPNLWGFYGAAVLIGLGNGHMWPAFQNMMITMAHHNERGTANSTILISWDIGMGLGVLAGGAIAEITGYSAAFWTVAVMNAIGVALYFLKTQNFFLTRRIEEA